MNKSAVALWAAAWFPWFGWTNDKSNIILCRVEEIGWTDCGVNGFEYNETSGIDRLAAQFCVSSMLSVPK